MQTSYQRDLVTLNTRPLCQDKNHYARAGAGSRTSIKEIETKPFEITETLDLTDNFRKIEDTYKV